MISKLIRKVGNRAKYLVNTYRTDPVSGTILLGALGSIPLSYDGPKSLVLPLAWVVIGGVRLTQQLNLRKRLEKFVETYGYDDAAFRKSISTWCGRQASRVAAENSGCLEEYVSLCEKERDNISFPNLRHI